MRGTNRQIALGLAAAAAVFATAAFAAHGQQHQRLQPQRQRPEPPKVPFALGVDMRLQIALERSGFSVNCVDGSWGARSEAALRAWCQANAKSVPATRADALALVADGAAPYVLKRVTAADHASLVKIPSEPREKARLHYLGYESILEMYAERGHMSQTALRRLNPSLKWPNPAPGSLVRLPNVSTTNAPPKAALVRVSLAAYSVSAYDADGRLVARFPCSIAADKRNLPPVGEIRVQGIAPRPNYTYTAPALPGEKKQRFIYAEGPNNPVGLAWVGLSIPSYGIHGTPSPETVGSAESHGCFRLANWNAVRLAAMLSEGAKVIIE